MEAVFARMAENVARVRELIAPAVPHLPDAAPGYASPGASPEVLDPRERAMAVVRPHRSRSRAGAPAQLFVASGPSSTG